MAESHAHELARRWGDLDRERFVEVGARQQVDGGFLMMQMELREKLESMAELVDPEPVLEHLLSEIHDDQQALHAEFARAYSEENYTDAASACVKLQYLDKLQREAEQIESDLMD